MRIKKIVLILAITLSAVRIFGAPLSEEELRALGITTSSARPPSVVPNSNTSWSWTYGPFRYDGSGNIASIDQQTFFYDKQNRLVQAGITRPDQPGVQTEAYTYDAFGNMTARARNGNGPAILTNSATNRLNGPWVLYDEAGNLTQWQADDGHVYVAQYDALNRLQNLKLANESADHRTVFMYTADGERIWSWDTHANVSHWSLRGPDAKVLRTFVNDGNNWSLDRDYIYREDLLLAAITPSTTEHFSLDHLGTPRVVTNDSRVRIGFHHYFPFGDEWSIGDGVQEGERMKFTGHERDADIAGGANGLDYMHARYYRAAVGRFLSVDPSVDIDKAFIQPQRWNRYAYVQDDPLRYTDPNGRDGRDFLNALALGPVTLATGRDVLQLGKDAIHYDQVRAAFTGFGSAPANEKAMAVAIGIIAVADIAANALQPEKTAVEEGTVKAGTIILGHFPENKVVAEKIGAEFLNITNWTFGRNRAWLRDALRAGKDILLSVDPSKVRAGSVTEKELKYLAKRGWEFVYDASKGLWKAVKVAK